MAVLLGLLLAAPALGQDRSVAVHPLTGVAMSGYDPVSYFTEPEPLRGLPDFVHEWSGVPWYFASAANRDIFALAPEIYAPLFGGHCAMSMARGYRSTANPAIYRVVADRLVLFHSVGNREAFILNPSGALSNALAVWDRLPDPYPDARVALPRPAVAADGGAQ